MKQLIGFILLMASAVGLLGSCKSSESAQTVNIEQDRDDDVITGDDYVYHLPVIFHVFYKDAADTRQYIKYARIKQILENVNTLWAGGTYGSSENINVQFELAECDENGKKLSTPGVEYIKWTGDYPMDRKDFMNDNSRKYWKYIWEPNEYINVMLYNFETEDSTSTVLGVSHQPYCYNGYPNLEGLNNATRASLSKNSLKYAYCVSINSLFASAAYDSDRYTMPGQEYYSYNSYDVNVTLAHELGHYLGLYHVFCCGDEDSAIDYCADEDYCTDTQTYNRAAYTEYMTAYLKDFVEKNGKNTPLSSKTDMPKLALRANCSGEQWTSVNLMDYNYSYAYQFSAEQKNRIRQVLYYSTLIPGPKKSTTSRGAVETVDDGPIDLPISVIE